MEERIIPINIMKTNQESKKEFSISSVNNVIGKLNKTSLSLIIVVYICVLAIVLSFVGKNISYITEPSYDHVFYNDEITPQISIVGRRTVSSDNTVNLKYNINAYITSRYVDSTAPKLDITNFRMFAITSDSLTSNDKLSNYYFTEQSGYTTPVTHTYTIDNSSVEQHPSSMYVRLAYKKDGEKQIATFKEPIMLQPTSEDKSIMDQWYELNKAYYEGDTKIPGKSAVDIYGSNDKTTSQGTFEIAAYKESDSKDYTVNVRVKIKNQASKQFHIDLQTWVVNDKDEYLPLIGGYNYSSQVSMYTNNTTVPGQVKPKYLALKLVYRDQDNKETNTIYLKQAISEIKETLSTTPDTPGEQDIQPKNNNLVTLIAIIGGTIVLVACLVIVLTIVDKKKKQTNSVEDIKTVEEKQK